MKNTNEGVFLEADEYKEYLESNRLPIEKGTVIEQDENGQPRISLYELNRNMIFQLGVMTEEKMVTAKTLLQEWTAKTEFNSYYMFLCREQSYYTVFDCSKSHASASNFISEFFGLLEDFAQIFDISEDNNGAIAVWANWDEGMLPDCYYLFPYSKGVIVV